MKATIHGGRVVLLTSAAIALAIFALQLPWFSINTSYPTHSEHTAFMSYGYEDHSSDVIRGYQTSDYEAMITIMGLVLALILAWALAGLAFIAYTLLDKPAHSTAAGILVFILGIAAILIFAIGVGPAASTRDTPIGFIGLYKGDDWTRTYGPSWGFIALAAAVILQAVGVFARLNVIKTQKAERMKMFAEEPQAKDPPDKSAL